MIKIILDQLKRRWLMWSFFSLASMVAGLVLGLERDIRISSIVWCSISIVVLDWNLGCVRVLLSLPFTARQIGRAYWWLCGAVPTILFAVFSGIGSLIISLAGTHGKFLGAWLQMFIEVPQDTGLHDKFPGMWLVTVLVASLLCGSFFWLLSGAIWAAALSRAGEPWRKRWPPQLYACIFAIALAAGIYFLWRSTISITDKVVIACLFGFVFSVLGWFRAESLFIDHSSSRRDVAAAGETRGKFEPRPGYGGMPYLIIRVCLFYLAIVAFMTASIIVIGNIASWFDHRAKWTDVVSPVLLGFQIYLFIFCFAQMTIIGTHLKFLRSLPMTSRRLAAIILSLAIVPVMILGGASMLFFLILPGDLSVLSTLKLCLLNLAPVWVVTTGVIWWSEQLRRITGVIMAWLVAMVPVFYQLETASRGGVPIWIVIAIPVVCLFIASFAIRRLLERNEMVYRMKSDMAPNWP